MSPCELCKRDNVPLTKHHLIPKAKGGNKGPVIMICPDCHGVLHQLYTEKEIAIRLHTLEDLLADEKLSKSIKFISKQPATKRVTLKRHKTKK